VSAPRHPRCAHRRRESKAIGDVMACVLIVVLIALALLA